MTKTIDTPHGSYQPLVPSKEEMNKAAALMHDAVEAIAELNHDVWSDRRIAEGWRYGEKRSDDSKLHPCLVAYAHLPETEKAYDRDTAKVVVAELLRRGLIRGS
ncbi:MAG: RyR domain-containing protein [Gallionellaceae bacterium]